MSTNFKEGRKNGVANSIMNNQTSNVALFYGERDSAYGESNKNLTCWVNTSRVSLTDHALNIHLANTSLAGSQFGIHILVIQNSFTISPIQTTDFYSKEKLFEPIRISLQSFCQAAKLRLDKPNYQVGDSLYGYIYMKAHKNLYAKGYFRAKIE